MICILGVGRNDFPEQQRLVLHELWSWPGDTFNRQIRLEERFA